MTVEEFWVTQTKYNTPFRVKIVQLDLKLNTKTGLTGAIKIKNVPKSGKRPKGEGAAPEIKKSTIQNVDFLIRGGGGEAIFSFFSQM